MASGGVHLAVWLTVPEDFLFTLTNGDQVVPNLPADAELELNERNTVVVFGDFAVTEVRPGSRRCVPGQARDRDDGTSALP